MSRVFWQGALTGIVVGMPLDLIFGKYLGLATYLLGFSPFFLLLLGALGWGLFAANILLMQQARLLHFFFWAMFVAGVSEVINLFFPLFTYPFSYASIEYVSIAFGSLLVLAIVIALAFHILFGRRFVFLDNVIKR